MSTFSDMLAIAIQVNQTTMVVGPPGVGKTACAKALAKELEARRFHGKPFPLVFQSLAQIMPEDLAGAQVPNHESRTMDSYMMGTLKNLIHASQGIYFGDEYGSCSPAVRAAFLNAAQDRLFGDTYLPNVSVVCCMNPPDQATNGQDMSAPESNRFFWVKWELDNEQWFDYLRGGKGAVAQFPLVPSDYDKTHLPKARQLVAMFLKRRPELIHKQPSPEKATNPWPSHRSWTNAANMLSAVLACGYELQSDHVNLAVEGCVGNAVASEFFTWVRDMDLPDPEELLKDATNSKGANKTHELLPTRHDRVIVCLESVAAAACEDRPDLIKRWQAAWDVLLPVLAVHQDRVMSAAQILSHKNPKGVKYPDAAGKILKIRKDMGISKATVG